MLDFTKLFTDAFETIRKNPVTLFPLSLAILFILMISGGFVIISGISEPLQLYMQAANEYDALKTSYLLDPSNIEDDAYLQELAARAARETDLSLDDSTYYEGLDAYIDEHHPGLNEQISTIASTYREWITLLVFLCAFAMLYATCATYAAISQILRKKTQFISLANNKMLPLIGLSITSSIIAFLPLTLLALLIILGILLATIVELVVGPLLLLLVLAIIATLLLMIFLSFRLFLAQAALFNNHGVFSSIKQSFKLTKPKTPNVTSAIIAFLIIIAISSFVGGIFSGAAAAFGQQIIIPSGPLDMIAGVILFIPFAAAFIFISSFIISFTLHTYAHLARR